MKRIISTFLIVSLLFCMVNIQASQNDYDLKETITVNNSELYIDDPTQAVAEEENDKDEMDFADDRVIVKVADDTTTILTLAVNVLLYYFVLRINKETKRNSELKLLNMQYEGVKHREENLKNLYEGVNSLKHDLSKHLTAIKAKAEDSKDEEIVKYIDTIMDENIRNVQKVVITDSAGILSLRL